MKKYIIAASIAVMALVMSAFAASFTINNNVLAAGSADVTNCGSDELNVVSWGADFHGGNTVVWYVTFDATDLEGCGAEEEIMVRVFDDNGGTVATTVKTTVDDAKDDNGRVRFANPVDIERIHELQVMIHTKTTT